MHTIYSTHRALFIMQCITVKYEETKERGSAAIKGSQKRCLYKKLKPVSSPANEPGEE
jgi:hypothetical protein